LFSKAQLQTGTQKSTMQTNGLSTLMQINNALWGDKERQSRVISLDRRGLIGWARPIPPLTQIKASPLV
jgi:hypothetical protein